MNIDASGRRTTRPHRRPVLRRVSTVLAALGLIVTGTSAPAVAHVSRPTHDDTTVTVRPATARLGDGDHNLLVFINKSRASLCTDERIAYEQAFIAWLDGGQQGDPPTEPASSQQGVNPVRFTQHVEDGVTTSSVDGPNLPVEVWRPEDNPDGIDCTATDGPGAALLATGTMTWHVRSVTAPHLQASDTSLQGYILGTDSRTYRYTIRYLFSQRDGHDPSFKAIIHLEPVR